MANRHLTAPQGNSSGLGLILGAHSSRGCVTHWAELLGCVCAQQTQHCQGAQSAIVVQRL